MCATCGGQGTGEGGRQEGAGCVKFTLWGRGGQREGAQEFEIWDPQVIPQIDASLCAAAQVRRSEKRRTCRRQDSVVKQRSTAFVESTTTAEILFFLSVGHRNWVCTRDIFSHRMLPALRLCNSALLQPPLTGPELQATVRRSAQELTQGCVPH